MIEVASGGVAGDGDGDKAQLLDAAFEFFGGFLRLLLGDQRNALQALRIGLGILSEPGVVAMGDGAGEVMIFEKRQT